MPGIIENQTKTSGHSVLDFSFQTIIPYFASFLMHISVQSYKHLAL